MFPVRRGFSIAGHGVIDEESFEERLVITFQCDIGPGKRVAQQPVDNPAKNGPRST